MSGVEGLAASLALLAAGSSPAGGPWILTCSMPPAAGSHSVTNEQRVFRLGPGLFQEWKEGQQEFGPNLCSAFACARTGAGLEGKISSTTMNLIVRIDPQTGAGSWRVEGASNLRTTEGGCAVKADTARPPKAG